MLPWSAFAEGLVFTEHVQDINFTLLQPNKQRKEENRKKLFLIIAMSPTVHRAHSTHF